jgi:geranylgeranyl diphosphate synthase, type I
VTVQAGAAAPECLEDAWPRQRLEAELTAMLSRRLAELGFLGEEIIPFDGVLGRLVRGPGKRLRPAFLYWGYRAAGGPASGPGSDAALRVGCAVEFLHACALICDDLMDGSAVRRWAPAAHVALAKEHASSGWRGDAERFGQAAALTLGLQAFTWADAAICEAGLPPDRLASVLRLFTTLRTEVIGGQYLDVVSACRGTADSETVRQIVRYKSAKYTVQRPIQLGAVVAGLDGAGAPGGAGGPDPGGFLSGYSLPLGEAFQLRDDILGVFGDPSVTGKPADEDIREGKQTLLLVLGRQMAGPARRMIIDQVAGNPGASPDEVADVRRVLAGCGALDAVERRISGLADRAAAAVAAQPGLPGEARAALLSLAAQAIRRDR